MAASYTKVPVGLIFFILFVFLSLQPSSPQHDGEVSVSPLRQIIRNRRQVCADGTYEHEGRTCCLCAAGQYLKNHCSSSQDDRVCEQCPSGTYNSDPNNLDSCQPCTSCSHPNANLEVAEPCTIARDTKCRCQKGHFCTSDAESCKICQPCTECSTDIKDTCAADCNGPEGSQTGVIVGSVFAVIAILAAAAAAIFYWKKRQAARQPQTQEQTPPNGGPADVEMQPFIDIHRVLPEIAEKLEWKDVERLAMQSGMSAAAIQSCRSGHPDDGEEQTFQLLKKWVETEGRNASNMLVQNLLKRGKKAKAEAIQGILRSNNPT